MSRPVFARFAPHARALFILVHCIAIIMLALPGDSVVGKARWNSKNLKSDFAGWSSALAKVGIRIPPHELGTKVHAVAQGYVDIRNRVITPFSYYREATGAKQGWAMFASPQRHPVEVHVDGLADGKWRPLYRTRKTEWMSRQMDHNRLRKLVGRFAREYRENVFRELATFLARRAFQDFADLSEVRVRLYRTDSLPAERIRAGEKPPGKYTESRDFKRKDFE